MQVCTHCHLQGEGKYCSNCGEIYRPGRITLRSVLHEVVHTFTHADHGFLYTLKSLAIRPGIMQKNYLEGERKSNQKPFSLFLSALLLQRSPCILLMPHPMARRIILT